MIIFVGDKPSTQNVDPSVPFVGTQSYKRLLVWIWQMDLDISEVKLTNITGFMNRVPREIRYGAKFVALGKNAAKFLDGIELGYRMYGGFKPPYKLLGDRSVLVKYFELPHPSGLNRKLNNKRWLNKQLKECKKWISKD